MSFMITYVSSYFFVYNKPVIYVVYKGYWSHIFVEVSPRKIE